MNVIIYSGFEPKTRKRYKKIPFFIHPGLRKRLELLERSEAEELWEDSIFVLSSAFSFFKTSPFFGFFFFFFSSPFFPLSTHFHPNLKLPKVPRTTSLLCKSFRGLVSDSDCPVELGASLCTEATDCHARLDDGSSSGNRRCTTLIWRERKKREI